MIKQYIVVFFLFFCTSISGQSNLEVFIKDKTLFVKEHQRTAHLLGGLHKWSEVLLFQNRADTLDIIANTHHSFMYYQYVKKKDKWIQSCNRTISGNYLTHGVYLKHYDLLQPTASSFEFTDQNCIRYLTVSGNIIEVPMEYSDWLFRLNYSNRN